jgi:hypothetical protein
VCAIIQLRQLMLTQAKPMWHHKSAIARFKLILRLMTDLIALRAFAFRQRRATAAEILVLRRQIALYKERGIKPARPQAVELSLGGKTL